MVVSNVTPKVQARFGGLENMLKSLIQPTAGNRKPLKKFKQKVKSILTFFPAFQVLPSSPSDEGLLRELRLHQTIATLNFMYLVFSAALL